MENALFFGQDLLSSPEGETQWGLVESDDEMRACIYVRHWKVEDPGRKFNSSSRNLLRASSRTTRSRVSSGSSTASESSSSFYGIMPPASSFWMDMVIIWLLSFAVYMVRDSYASFILILVGIFIFYPRLSERFRSFTVAPVVREIDVPMQSPRRIDAILMRIVEFKTIDSNDEVKVFTRFPKQEKPVWCSALAAAQLYKHGLPRKARSLVFDYWFGEVEEFTTYDNWNINEGKEATKLRDFKKQLTALSNVLKGGGKLWITHLLKSRQEQCRFLVARDWNLQKAFALVQKALELRKTHSLDTILKTGKNYQHFKEQIPMYHQGWDDHGRLVAIRLLGKLKPKGLNVDEVRDVELSLNELAQRIFTPAISRIMQRTQWRSHAIVDMEGAGVSDFLDREFRKVFTISASVVQVCYPENLGVCSVVRAPRTFSFIWGLVKTVLTKRTQGKIVVDSSSNPGRALLPKFQETDCLPIKYGGNAENPGPEYKNSELEQIAIAYLSGKRDIRELIPDNSEYSFIPVHNA
mmetsp:Transcript_14356/g.21809  ORF Transcript_14356/g.21809 Transcript_14356/m.21809 type:complete len:523 (-) Transcript_14356:260-1828(-)